MAGLRFITNAKGDKVAAVVPIDEWKKIRDFYRRMKKREKEDAEADPPKIDRKRKLYEVKESPIHGRGVFATEKIKKGTAVIEYKGQIISQDEADARLTEDDSGHYHTVLFMIDEDYVIDASRKGNNAKYINHSCDPNCEAIQYGSRVFIETIKDIPKGAELTYDYHLQVDKPYTKKKLKQYACHCGSKNCRGTQIDLDS